MLPARRLPDAIHTIPEALAFWAEETPSAPALAATAGPVLSHRALHDAVARVAHRLSERGIGRQDRIALMLPPGLDACVALLGGMASAIAAALNPSSPASELSRELYRLRPRLIVTGGKLAVSTSQIATNLGIPIAMTDELLAPHGAQPVGDPPGAATDSEHIAVIQHTSGTMALPKQVPRTHGSYLAAVRVARDALHLTPDDVLLLTAGAHHNLGLADLLAALLNGGSCIVADGFDPRAFPGLLRKHQPTWAVLTPYEISLLLAHASAGGLLDIPGPASRLRAVLAEAQASPAETLAQAERALGVPVLTGYGMTETGNIARFGIADGERRAGSCGRSWCLEIRIVDHLGDDLPQGVPGEVVVRGPTVFSGYLDDPEARAAAFLPGGWFRTGDLGHLDADGYLSLTGRLGETINRGGEMIAPAEVEAALASHAAVAEAAVFPVPDARLGEDIVAAVVIKPGTDPTPRALREWLLGRLSPHKVPRRIWLVAALPRTPAGKVPRHALSEQFSREST